MEWFVDDGEFLREQFPSQKILKSFGGTFRKREKVFQVSENTTKIRDEFLGCYKPSPLKIISSRDSETNRDSRGYNKIFLVWFNIPLYLKTFCKTFSTKYWSLTYKWINTRQDILQEQILSRHDIFITLIAF